MTRRIETQAEQWPRRVAADLGLKDAYDPGWVPGKLGPRAVAPQGASWYHVTNRRMRPGTVLVPKGGKSPYGDIYRPHRIKDPAARAFLGDPVQDFTGRDNWVWLEHDLDHARWREGKYLYRVEPAGGPHPWNDLGQDGWVTPSATVVEQLPRYTWSRS